MSPSCKCVTIPATTLHPEPAYAAPSDADSSSDELAEQGLSPAEAARRLGVSRSRIYALVELGALESLGSSAARSLGLRVSLASVERRRQAAARSASRSARAAPGASWRWRVATPPSATHVAARLSDPDRSRARSRLLAQSLLQLLPRLRGRASLHRYAVGAEALVTCSATLPGARRPQRRACAQLEPARWQLAARGLRPRAVARRARRTL